MQRIIKTTLEQVEKEHALKILFACESGSRAWGFASPDSDYDVRFIYAKPISWHLQLNKEKDTFEVMLPGDLDLSGWELGKSLRLFAGCNLPLNEWLASPIVYCKEPEFFRVLNAEIDHFFNPKKALFHYLAITRNALCHVKSESIGIKKLFYAIRPLFACVWIKAFGTMPPTDFDAMVHHRELMSKDLFQEIQSLKERKAKVPEGFEIHIPRLLQVWIQATREHMMCFAEGLKSPTMVGDPEVLNRLMYQWTPCEPPEPEN